MLHSADCNYRRCGTTFKSHFQGTISPILLGPVDPWRWDKNVGWRITNPRCVTFQKRENLFYPAAVVCHHAFQKFIVHSLKIYNLSSDLFIHYLRFIWSQGSVTRILTTQGCKKQNSRSIFGRCKSFYSKRSVRLWCPPSLPFSGYRRLFPGVYSSGRKKTDGPSPPSIVEAKNKWAYNSNPTCLIDAFRNFSKCISSFASYFYYNFAFLRK